MPKYLLLILLFINSYTIINCQNTKDLEKPKVGLVLSGGGAKGIAHVGVLKVLEEVGIQPDYITGTSMGSIIGGLYAIGYTANEMDSIIRNINWERTLSDKIPLNMVVPEQKKYYNKFLFNFDITKKGLQFPTGMVNGQGIFDFFNYLSWHVAKTDNFNDFMIPFRCVASDLISGKTYNFSHGNLPIAMRSSMAIPTIFSPVKLDSMLLVDGGALNNVPVKLCREMGADIVITVNVGTNKKPSFNDFKGITDIFMGAAMIKSTEQTLSELKASDVIITPDLKNYGVGDFTSGVEIMKLGEIAALKQIDELYALADFLSQYKTKKKQIPPKLKKIFIENIYVDSLKHLNKSFIIGKFGLTKGHWYDEKQINGGLYKIIGSRYIKTINYRLTHGKKGYNITLIPIEEFNNKFNFGLHYDKVYKAGAILDLSLKNFLIKGSFINIGADISEYPQIRTNFINYIGASQKWGVFINSKLESNYTPYFSESGDKIGKLKSNFFILNTGLLYSPNTTSLLKLSIYYKHNLFKSYTGLLKLLAENIKRIGNSSFGTSATYCRNSLNKQYFADKGSNLTIHLDFPIKTQEIFKGSYDSYLKFKNIAAIPEDKFLLGMFSYCKHIKINNKFDLEPNISVGLTTGKMGYFQYFNIGGLKSTIRTGGVPFAGMIPKEVQAKQYALTQLNLRYTPFNNFFIKLSGGLLDYSSDYEGIDMNNYRVMSTENIITSGQISFSYNSLLGPITIGYGRSSLNKKSRWTFTAGFTL